MALFRVMLFSASIVFGASLTTTASAEDFEYKIPLDQK